MLKSPIEETMGEQEPATRPERIHYVTISLILSSSIARLISIAIRLPTPNVVPY